jgi:hypothetical protein
VKGSGLQAVFVKKAEMRDAELAGCAGLQAGRAATTAKTGKKALNFVRAAVVSAG